jgi:hypothetical protein
MRSAHTRGSTYLNCNFKSHSFCIFFYWDTGMSGSCLHSAIQPSWTCFLLLVSRSCAVTKCKLRYSISATTHTRVKVCSHKVYDYLLVYISILCYQLYIGRGRSSKSLRHQIFEVRQHGLKRPAPRREYFAN